MAARDHAQGARITRHRVQIERHLVEDTRRLAAHAATPVGVGMPAGIAHIEVAITAQVVVIFAQQRAKNAIDARIIEQRSQVFVLIDKGYQAGACAAVMRFAIVATAVLDKDGFELFDNSVDLVTQ